MEPDIEAQLNAQTVLDHIEANPEKHDQSHWAQVGECGTAACIAGWTAVLCGGWEFAQSDPIWNEEHVLSFKAPGKTSTRMDPAGIAGKLLGLDDDDALGNDALELFFIADKEAAKEALRYIANGKQIDWEKIRKEYGDADGCLRRVGD